MSKTKIRNVVFNADVKEALRTLPDDSIHCFITSPPYYGVRVYAGTTAITAWYHGRDYCGSEISKKYCEMIERTLKPAENARLDQWIYDNKPSETEVEE